MPRSVAKRSAIKRFRALIIDEIRQYIKETYPELVGKPARKNKSDEIVNERWRQQSEDVQASFLRGEQVPMCRLQPYAPVEKQGMPQATPSRSDKDEAFNRFRVIVMDQARQYVKSAYPTLVGCASVRNKAHEIVRKRWRQQSEQVQATFLRGEHVSVSRLQPYTPPSGMETAVEKRSMLGTWRYIHNGITNRYTIALDGDTLAFIQTWPSGFSVRGQLARGAMCPSLYHVYRNGIPAYDCNIHSWKIPGSGENAGQLVYGGSGVADNDARWWSAELVDNQDRPAGVIAVAFDDSIVPRMISRYKPQHQKDFLYFHGEYEAFNVDLDTCDGRAGNHVWKQATWMPKQGVLCANCDCYSTGGYVFHCEKCSHVICNDCAVSGRGGRPYVKARDDRLSAIKAAAAAELRSVADRLPDTKQVKYLPEFLSGKRILVAQGRHEYLVDNSQRQAATIGLHYWNRPVYEDRDEDPQLFAPWGSVVKGELFNDWLKLEVDVGKAFEVVENEAEMPDGWHLATHQDFMDRRDSICAKVGARVGGLGPLSYVKVDGGMLCGEKLVCGNFSCVWKLIVKYSRAKGSIAKIPVPQQASESTEVCSESLKLESEVLRSKRAASPLPSKCARRKTQHEPESSRAEDGEETQHGIDATGALEQEPPSEQRPIEPHQRIVDEAGTQLGDILASRMIHCEKCVADLGYQCWHCKCQQHKLNMADTKFAAFDRVLITQGRFRGRMGNISAPCDRPDGTFIVMVDGTSETPCTVESPASCRKVVKLNLDDPVLISHGACRGEKGYIRNVNYDALLYPSDLTKSYLVEIAAHPRLDRFSLATRADIEFDPEPRPRREFIVSEDKDPSFVLKSV